MGHHTEIQWGSGRVASTDRDPIEMANTMAAAGRYLSERYGRARTDIRRMKRGRMAGAAWWFLMGVLATCWAAVVLA